MNFLFEILILGILVFGGYAGIKYGFIRIAEKPIKVTLSLVFAFSLCSVVGKGLIAPLIQSPVTNYVKDFMYENCSSLTPDNVPSEIPTLLKMAGAAFNQSVSYDSSATTDEILGTVVTNLTSPFINLISIVFAFIVLFFVGKLLIKFGIHMVQLYCDGGILAKVNKGMGFVLAGFISIVAAWAFVGVTEFFFHLPIFNNSQAIQNFNGGLLYRLFNSISPIELLLSF